MGNRDLDFLGGEVLLINKPYGWTSFDVVNKIRCQLKYLYKIKKIKIGHAGTLDPLASGLLILCTGAFTKKIDTYQAFEKEYTGKFYIGATTPSSDMETEVDEKFETSHITPSMIYEAAKSFLGENEQMPPIFSAKKIGGQKLYDLARKGIEVVREPRAINISEFELLAWQSPKINFRVRCTKGTYVRTLALDLGRKLGPGAHLSMLRRTRSGKLDLARGHTLPTLGAMSDDQLLAALVPTQEAIGAAQG